MMNNRETFRRGQRGGSTQQEEVIQINDAYLEGAADMIAALILGNPRIYLSRASFAAQVEKLTSLHAPGAHQALTSLTEDHSFPGGFVGGVFEKVQKADKANLIVPVGGFVG